MEENSVVKITNDIEGSDDLKQNLTNLLINFIELSFHSFNLQEFSLLFQGLLKAYLYHLFL